MTRCTNPIAMYILDMVEKRRRKIVHFEIHVVKDETLILNQNLNHGVFDVSIIVEHVPGHLNSVSYFTSIYSLSNNH